jgi:polar amino acid transport system substrate-binding protein
VNRVALGAVALAVASVGITACGSSSSGSAGAGSGTTPSTPTTAAATACSPSTLKTVHSGVLTIGADNPVYAPWFLDNNPANGKGFEGALDQAIAQQLGYTPATTKFTHVTFNQAISPAPKNFDFDLDEFSISAVREKAVDFSSPYYDVNEGVIAMKGSKGAAVTDLAGLKQIKLGAQIGTTNETTISDVIKPSMSPGIYSTNAAAVQALKNGQIDGLVLDMPTAYEVTSEVPGSVIVGQLPATGSPEQFGALLDKDSPLTMCVSKAVDTLRSNGTLAQLQDKGLARVGKAPVLR